MKQKSISFRTVKAIPRAAAADHDIVVFLRHDTWNDYGFLATYHVIVRVSGRTDVDLGITKIVQRGQENGEPLIPERFPELTDDFCSLGQSFAYYEMLHAMGESVWRPFLHGLRDAVFDPVIHHAFEHEPGFKNSLLRGSGAERALEDAPVLFATQPSVGPPIGTNLAMTFRTTLGGSALTVPLAFNGSSDIPERWLAVIGYNGSGKTRLLANIGMIASTVTSDQDKESRKKYGYFESPAYSFGAVIAFSYSAFDTFEIPRFGREEREQKLQRGYFYCGLRKPGKATSNALKTIDELFRDFVAALERARTRDLRARYIAAIKILLDEPSLSPYRAMYELMNEDEAGCRQFFDTLSTGHKLVLNLVTQLIANLQPKSLVIFDEPESHLHPSLLSAMLKAIRFLLDDTDSFCIFATHSPVVLQETPGKQVLILRRNGKKSMVEQPERETFAENVGVLTSDVFNLTASETDFHYVLERLAKEHDVGSIEQMFGRPLGLQARSFIRSRGAGEP